MSSAQWGASPLNPFPLVESNDDAVNGGMRAGASLDSHENRSKAILISLWQDTEKYEPLLHEHGDSGGRDVWWPFNYSEYFSRPSYRYSCEWPGSK